MRQTLHVVVLFFMAGLLANAQNTGTISGTVTDPANAALLNANVTLSNQATGETREVKTNTEGAFVFTPLNPGTYKVKVEAAGFRIYNQENIVLQLNDRIGLPQIGMQVGSTTDSITVEATATGHGRDSPEIRPMAPAPPISIAGLGRRSSSDPDVSPASMSIINLTSETLTRARPAPCCR